MIITIILFNSIIVDSKLPEESIGPTAWPISGQLSRGYRDHRLQKISVLTDGSYYYISS